ncbi:glycosyltransferase [Paenibacillus polymyxa]|uniref:glycosyltransferase n=1 Tax=Paenibacillus polymyxa TaxID=1406 RepID=UPI000737B24B|nr:glycosyltransferase [Paenibacillus polymyxa]
MKTISLCMIVKNEELHLDKCLKSVVNKVDQIIIIDTGSTDQTIDIARRYTDELYHFEWINDFSAARNEALKYAECEYILVLDADEYLDENADLQKDLVSEADYYFVKIHNFLSGDRAIDHLAIRLFSNNKGMFYRNRLHEHLNTMDEERSYVAAHAEFKILHSGYTDEMLQDREKAKRNLPLMIQEVEENPNAYNLFNMGRTYMWIGEFEKAINYLKRAYPLSKDLAITPELVTSLCRCLGEMSRYSEALEILKDAVKVFPREVDMLHMQALYFMEEGYFKDAVATMEACIELGDQGITVIEGNGSFIAHYRLAEWYETKNDMLKSYDHITKALQDKKRFAAGLNKYLQITMKANIPLEDVYKSINQLYPLKDVKDLEHILEVLYALRHPLLHRYLHEFKVKVQESVQTVALQYAKEYKNAESEWLMMETIPVQNAKDVLLLAFLRKSDELLFKANSLLNLSNKEKKIIKKIYNNYFSPNDKLTSSIEEILLDISSSLIALKEFDLFEQLLKIIWEGSMEVKYKICQKLASHGFDEIAIDLLIKLFEKYPREIKVIRLLGDICLSKGYLQDAELFYAKLLELYSKYSSYERCFDLYERLEDNQSSARICESIKDKFPLCIWASKLSLS